MPVEFLSDAEAAAFGRYDGTSSREELDRVFFLDDADRELIDKRRGAHSRLGFALQLGTVRWLGAFAPDPTAVPAVVLDYAAQLEVEDPACVGRYLERRRTRFEHAEEIKLACGVRDFAAVGGEFERWVHARAWMTGDGSRAIFGDAVGWLRGHDVLLPGVARRKRDRAIERAHAALRDLDQRGETISFQAVARSGGVSRQWLYTQPELRAEIERLRARHPPAAPRVPDAERAREASLRQRNPTLLAENRRLRDQIAELKAELAIADGQRRAAH